MFPPRILTNAPSVMSLPSQISQTIVGTIGSSHECTLYQHHRKFFWFFSFKKRTRKPYSKLIFHHAHESDGGAAEGEIPKAGGDKVACAAGDGIDLATAEKLALAADAEQMAH